MFQIEFFIIVAHLRIYRNSQTRIIIRRLLAERSHMIPKECIILATGIPATGKTTFARYLARNHGFAHYDLECYPRGWPRPELKMVWDASRPAFVEQLRQSHHRVVLDWGFPVVCLPWVNELQAQDVKVVWFSGDLRCARNTFAARGGIPIGAFETQVKAIQEAGLPGPLNCIVVDALADSGTFLEPHEIEHAVFGE